MRWKEKKGEEKIVNERWLTQTGTRKGKQKREKREGK